MPERRSSASIAVRARAALACIVASIVLIAPTARAEPPTAASTVALPADATVRSGVRTAAREAAATIETPSTTAPAATDRPANAPVARLAERRPSLVAGLGALALNVACGMSTRCGVDAPQAAMRCRLGRLPSATLPECQDTLPR